MLSDMNHKVLTAYGILKTYPMQGDKYEFARRTTIVVDKQGIIQHVEFDSSAVDPTSAITVCTGLHKKAEPSAEPKK